MTHWHVRLNDAMERRGWTVVELSRRSEVDLQSLYKYVKGIVDHPRGDVMQKLAHTLGVHVGWLGYGLGARDAAIPVVGFVGAGEAWFPVDDHAKGAGLDFLEFDLGGTDPVAVQVRGGSMRPVYRPGDWLVGNRQRGINESDFLAQDCIVLTREGAGYVKTVRRGRVKGRYNLASYAADLIEDADLQWAAPIEWIKRAP